MSAENSRIIFCDGKDLSEIMDKVYEEIKVEKFEISTGYNFRETFFGKQTYMEKCMPISFHNVRISFVSDFKNRIRFETDNKSIDIVWEEKDEL